MNLSSKLLLGILLAGTFGILEAKIPAVATLEYFYAKDGIVTGRSVNGKTAKYEYDAAGRLVKERTKSYTYSYLDKVLSVCENGANEEIGSRSGEAALSVGTYNAKAMTTNQANSSGTTLGSQLFSSFSATSGVPKAVEIGSSKEIIFTPLLILPIACISEKL